MICCPSAEHVSVCSTCCGCVDGNNVSVIATAPEIRARLSAAKVGLSHFTCRALLHDRLPALQDLAACWDDHNLAPDQPPTPRHEPDSDTDSDSGQADSLLSGYGPAELAEYSIVLPGTPMNPPAGPMHKRAGWWLRKKWKKGLMLGAYLGKEMKEQMTVCR